MNLLKLITENPQIIGQVANQFGLSNQQAQSAVNPLLKSVGKALIGNMGKQGGLESLLGAIQSGNHGRYLEEGATSQFGSQEMTNDGNNILGHLLGSKDASRSVAKQAAEESGVGYEITKKILPLIAGLAMGGMNKQANNANLMNGLSSMLSGGSKVPQSNFSQFAKFLDMDGDGGMMDDVMNMASKFLQ